MIGPDPLVVEVVDEKFAVWWCQCWLDRAQVGSDDIALRVLVCKINRAVYFVSLWKLNRVRVSPNASASSKI
jgi:hypothetical protein